MRQITREEWKNKHYQSKMIKTNPDGSKTRYILSLENEGTCLIPVEIIKEKKLHKYVADTINKEFINSIAQGAADKILANRGE